MQLRAVLLLAAGHVAAATAGCAASSGEPLPSELERAERFEFALPDLDGRRIDARSLRGKVVLVDVWATWCEPCARSFPVYAELVRRHRADGFEVVAVSVDERVEDVRTWLEGKDFPFIVVHDPEGTLPERMGLKTMPSAVVLDRDGRVVGAHAGFRDGDEAEIEALVRAALAGGRAE